MTAKRVGQAQHSAGPERNFDLAARDDNKSSLNHPRPIKFGGNANT
jgi:hypothetical protein